MKVENQVQPSPNSIREFIAVEGPLMMVNLLKFREKAAYADGRDPDLSGREAYRRYAQAMKKLLEARGFEQVRAIIITGEGRAFCTGADVGRMQRGGLRAEREKIESQWATRAAARLQD